MTTETDPRSAFEAIVRAGSYMTLATADATGVPWASPVWFASTDCRHFFWVSSPQARHSQNLAVRPELAISIFDSHQPPYTGQGIYVSAIGETVPESELDAGLEVYSGVSRERGLPEWDRSKVVPPAKHRLYRASTIERFILAPDDTRTPVPLT
jgi:nitroimidazol reductase NimA-like FMN-containing flavoprotein (pyridoxamine 5'-phosphate oxidase superfamily)